MNTKVQKVMSDSKPCWSEALHCHWDSWRVVNESHLILDLPYQNVPDMSGTIKIAQILSPNVDRIDVYSGGLLNVQYFGTYNKEWRALVPAKRKKSEPIF